MKKIVLALAIICAMMTACSSDNVVVESDTDSVVEVVDSVFVDTVVSDTIL